MSYNEIITKEYVATCPHCGNTDYRDINEMPWDENEPEEITCEKCKKTIDNFSYKKYNVPRNAIRNFKKVSKRKKGECINYEKAD